MSRSKITLREANAVYRELRRNAKALMHRAETFLITAIVLYKILTNLFFLPAMRGIWSLTLRFSPVNYLTNNNAHQIFTAPSILGGIALIAVLAALWNLYEFSLVLHGLDFARRGEACKLRPLFRESFAAIRHAVFPKNWPILFYCAVLIPFTDVFVTSNYITQLAVPEYIMGIIRAKPIYLALYSAIFLAAVLLTVFFALVLPLFTLEHKNFGTAVKESCAYVKQRFFRVLAALARWNVGVLLRMGLLFVLGHDADVRHRGGGGAGEHPRHAPALPRAAIGGAALLRLPAGLQGNGGPVHHPRSALLPDPERRCLCAGRAPPTASAAAPAGGCC